MSTEAELEKEFIETMATLESRLHLPEKFIQRLLSEGDDWSFVIKLHALLESAVSHLLAISSGFDNVLEVFSRLELSDTSAGNLAFVRDLGLLDEDERRFIRSLSELRNKLVHDIKNVNFSFDRYMVDLDANQIKSFVKCFAYNLPEQIEIEGTTFTKTDLVKKMPRRTVYLHACVILGKTYRHYEEAEINKQIETLELRLKKLNVEKGKAVSELLLALDCSKSIINIQKLIIANLKKKLN